MSNRIKISAVSYANSYPFIYGLKNHPVSERIELELDTPADCARKLLKGEVDLGLVPVAIIPDLDESLIVSDFCIGSDGPVESVCLFSDVPLEQIETILLDYQSRTSVQLVKYLAENQWNISPNWVAADSDFLEQITGTTAGVVIGDRAFPLLEKYPVILDLSEEWKTHTDLPFVFACWVSNRVLDADFQDQFQEALSQGLSRKEEAIRSMANEDHENLVRYVESVISYDFAEEKRQAMKLFLDWMSKPK